VKRRTAELAEQEFDLLIVGGGIFGACAAWDAALRGFSVALIEKEDFGSGASANSFKMVHGGIRYLQHADIRRLRNSCFERSAMLRIAPHLVEPLPIVIPTYGYLQQGKPFLGTGMLLYDLLTYDRNRDIHDKARHIPISRFLSRRQTLDLFPDINRSGLTGATVFSDGQMYNPTRLVLAFVQSAAEAGARICNYIEATSFVKNRHAITGVTARDVLTDEKFGIRARVTLNATGPWAEDLLNRTDEKVAINKGTYSRDACFVIRRRFDHPFALAVQGRTRDPGAVLSREARHLFLVPWRDYTLIGVWHAIWHKGPDEIVIEAAELQSFVDEINWAYPGLQLDPREILMWNAGLVPFGENATGAVDLQYGKESRLIDHRKESNLDGLVTLIGVRYTMGRHDAAHAINLVSKKLGRKPVPAPTHETPVHGGQIENFGDLVDKVGRDPPSGLDPEVIEALLHNYGTEFRTILDLISENSGLGERLGSSSVLNAEVLNAVRNEMAMTLTDIVFRRTDLATGTNPGDDALNACAGLAATELGWSEQQTQSEIDRVRHGLTIPGH
jgi:glycerol-3-phosphate dehydrogenase